MEKNLQVNRGADNGRAKLTEEEVRHIRVLGEVEGKSAAEIARAYCLAAETVRRILRRETWGWLADVPRQVLTPEALQAEAQESLQRVLTALQGPSAALKPDPLEEWARVTSRKAGPPPSPLDGGEVPDAGEGDGLARLREAAEKEKAGDQMLEELQTESGVQAMPNGADGQVK